MGIATSGCSASLLAMTCIVIGAQQFKLQFNDPKENGCAGWHTRLVLHRDLGTKKEAQGPENAKVFIDKRKQK